MANNLFQQARQFVDEALHETHDSSKDTVAIAKNALSSAYANSTDAERAQLAELQEQLESKNK
jgi:hypothetical protein